MGNAEAIRLLDKDLGCHLFIVGHAAPKKTREEMVQWLKFYFPGTKILALNPPTDDREFTGADYTIAVNGSEQWLAAGQRPQSVPPQLNISFRPGIQPYMMSWLRYDPAKEIAALGAPVLIIQGTTDLQVSVEDARLLAVGAQKAKLFLVEGMNHILKQVSKESEKQTASYSDPILPVSPALINEISRFVHQAKK
jgi:hypothetical protein